MYRENYINSLRTELLETVAERLTPVALKYGYSEVPLETNIKWRPLVLVLGNYSSGKSTLINEFLGGKIQSTGQAPTDDSFTIITCDDSGATDGEVRITEQRDGKFLLNDPEYPFESLKKHGQRFASHFRLKKVNSPFLKNLAIIDTPGMLDSITERDRGYDYQEVIGDFAQIADLVLVLFDPHKAGTVREAHTSLRDTLPAKTFEDRVLFVLNRIDECTSLMDLLRVYGTLCWNLSQITGRKDIPMIHLTYSPHAAVKATDGVQPEIKYLRHLENQREELQKAILQAPCHRLDNLASFVETHSERLSHFLETLISFRKAARRFRIKHFFIGLPTSMATGVAGLFALMFFGILPEADLTIQSGIAGTLATACLILWTTGIRKFRYRRFHNRKLKNLHELTPMPNQTRRDNWENIRDLVYVNLKDSPGTFPLRDVRQEYAVMMEVYSNGSREIREALKELSALNPDEIGVAMERPRMPWMNGAEETAPEDAPNEE